MTDPSPPSSIASFTIKHSFAKNEGEGYTPSLNKGASDEGTRWLDNFYNMTAFSVDSMDQGDSENRSSDLSSASFETHPASRNSDATTGTTKGSIESFIKKHTDEPGTIVNRLKEMERLRKVLSSSFDEADQTNSEASSYPTASRELSSNDTDKSILGSNTDGMNISRSPSKDHSSISIHRSPSKEIYRSPSSEYPLELKRVPSKEIRRVSSISSSSKAEEEQNIMLGLFKNSVDSYEQNNFHTRTGTIIIQNENENDDVDSMGSLEDKEDIDIEDKKKNTNKVQSPVSSPERKSKSKDHSSPERKSKSKSKSTSKNSSPGKESPSRLMKRRLLDADEPPLPDVPTANALTQDKRIRQGLEDEEDIGRIGGSTDKEVMIETSDKEDINVNANMNMNLPLSLPPAPRPRSIIKPPTPPTPKYIPADIGKQESDGKQPIGALR